MRVLLDGHHLHSPAEVYEALAPALGFPPHFGANADALWDVLTERGPSDLEVVWRHTDRSAVELGVDYQRLVAVLKAAADAGLLSFELS
jgi:RNAse (barnase) inhibitor barstar